MRVEVQDRVDGAEWAVGRFSKVLGVAFNGIAQHLKPNRSRPLRQKGSLLLPSITKQFFSRFELAMLG